MLCDLDQIGKTTITRILQENKNRPKEDQRAGLNSISVIFAIETIKKGQNIFYH